MKSTILKNPWRASQHTSSALRASGTALTAALLLLAAANLRAGVPDGVVVGTLCGGGPSPFYGYVEGNPITSTDAQFHTPIGLATDSTGGYLAGYLIVADRDNNAIRAVDLAPPSAAHCNFTYTFAPIPGFTPSGAISSPVGVALDAEDNVYVLNRGNGKNGTVVEFDCYGYLLSTNAVALTNANAITLDDAGNIYLTASNSLIRITPAGVQNTVAIVTNAGACLQGLVVMGSGTIAVCDSGRNGIYLINPVSGVISTNTGFNGAGDNENIWDATLNNPVPKTMAMFNQPMGLALAGNNILIVADYGNNRVKVVDAAGTVTNLYGVSSSLWLTGSGLWPGWHDGKVTVPDAVGDVEARLPNGVLLAGNSSNSVTVYVTEDYYHLIRTVTGSDVPPPPPNPPAGLTAVANCGQVSLTWSASLGATNYNVKRSATSGGPYTNNIIASTSATSYTDTNVFSGTTYYYVVSAVGVGGEGANSVEVSATLPLPPPPTIMTVITNYGQVALTWSAVSCPSVAYNVERSTTNGGPYAILANTSATSYTDTNVIDGTTYYYVVSALSDGGQGPNSAQVSATPPLPLPPTILTVATNCAQATLTWSAVVCPSISYNVKRSSSSGGPYTTIANTASTSYTDTSVLSGTTNYYVISALSDGGESTNSAQAVVWVPHCQVLPPTIGYVDFPGTTYPVPYTSIFHPVSSFIANNDVPIVIEGTNGSQTFYTYGATGSSIPDPTSASASDPVGYEDGMSASQVAYYTIPPCLAPLGDLTIKAIGEKADGSPNSAIVSARLQFITGNPVITGDNAAQFTVSDITTNAEMWYTTDGSNPTNAAPSVGPIASGTTLSLAFPAGASNLTFKVIAFRPCYEPSTIIPVIFSATNFVPNSISFGFASGEASSQFIGSPGQTFYAPVTLSPLPATLIYSLQFNLTVNPGGGNPGPALTPGAYSFQSFLVQPIPGTTPVLYMTIPPAMFLTSATNPAPVVPTNQVFQYNGGWFESLIFTNTSLNLLGVGWLDTYYETNLYNTLQQDLIAYSKPHATLFTPAMGKVVLGGYAFQIPPTAAPGQTYQIQIGLPSATSDGIGAPGSAVYIATPTSGSLSNGAMNSIKIVTAGQRKYIAGDCAPFGWFNAGDFGDTNLDNSDVEQVFQSAIYGWWMPPPNSDFFDSMDSCGGTYMDLGHGYLEFNSYISGPGALNPLFDGNDTSINQIAFGDGVLDVCDVYVTFRRSLDPSLDWFQRFWTNGVRGAQILASPLAAVKSQAQPAGSPAPQVASATTPPSVNFAATDFIASAGQTLQVPITATIFGNYPLRVLMLSLSVEPLDGSPALTSPVQFKPNAALGTPALTSSSGNGNYAATWLDSTIAGLTGTASLGTLTVTVPANASSLAAYAVHFDHASASPNGLASFPKQTLTGLITLSSRTNSYYNDGIPDSWRLRWFGTIYNALSERGADACGDGINNWEKYIAGTDPTDPTAYPRLNPRTPPPAGSTVAIHWPTVSGKRYVIERSASLFPGTWTAITTNTGTGTDLEFDDNNSSKTSFYRVWILP